MVAAGLGDPQPAVLTLIPIPESPNLKISIAFSGFEIIEGACGASLRIPGQASTATPGAPDVPGIPKLVPGIKGMRAVLTLHGFDPTNVLDVIVAPAKGYTREVPEGSGRVLPPQRQPDPGIYRTAEFWPSELGRVDEAWIGTQKVVRVECFPVQYNPVLKTIRFYRRLEGVLRFERIENSPSP